ARVVGDAPAVVVGVVACGRGGTGRSLAGPTGAPAEPGDRPGTGRARCARGLARDRTQAAAAFRWLLVRRLRVQAWAHTQLFLDLLLDFVGEIGVVAQEVPRVLLALPKLVALVGVPGTGLAHDGLLHPEVDETALPADADPEQDVELRGSEGRSALVLDDLDLGAAADGVGAVLERLDPPHVEPH